MKRMLTLLLSLPLSMPLGLLANMGADSDTDQRDSNYVEGRKALEKQDWPKAIELLGKAAKANAQDADAENGLGYAYRMSGKLEEAFKHYHAALALNPKHKAAHEYIGEAYLNADDLGKAEEHLAALQLLCSPIPCEELKDLKRAIEIYKKARK